MINDEQLEALIKLGNSDEVVRLCEPNLAYHFELKAWMIKRTLTALELMEKKGGV